MSKKALTNAPKNKVSKAIRDFFPEDDIQDTDNLFQKYFTSRIMNLNRKEAIKARAARSRSEAHRRKLAKKAIGQYDESTERNIRKTLLTNNKPRHNEPSKISTSKDIQPKQDCSTQKALVMPMQAQDW